MDMETLRIHLTTLCTLQSPCQKDFETLCQRFDTFIATRNTLTSAQIAHQEAVLEKAFWALVIQVWLHNTRSFSQSRPISPDNSPIIQFLHRKGLMELFLKELFSYLEEQPTFSTTLNIDCRLFLYSENPQSEDCKNFLVNIFIPLLKSKETLPTEISFYSTDPTLLLDQDQIAEIIQGVKAYKITTWFDIKTICNPANPDLDDQLCQLDNAIYKNKREAFEAEQTPMFDPAQMNEVLENNPEIPDDAFVFNVEQEEQEEEEQQEEQQQQVAEEENVYDTSLIDPNALLSVHTLASILQMVENRPYYAQMKDAGITNKDDLYWIWRNFFGAITAEGSPLLAHQITHITPAAFTHLLKFRDYFTFGIHLNDLPEGFFARTLSTKEHVLIFDPLHPANAERNLTPLTLRLRTRLPPPKVILGSPSKVLGDQRQFGIEDPIRIAIDDGKGGKITFNLFEEITGRTYDLLKVQQPQNRDWLFPLLNQRDHRRNPHHPPAPLLTPLHECAKQWFGALMRAYLPPAQHEHITLLIDAFFNQPRNNDSYRIPNLLVILQNQGHKKFSDFLDKIVKLRSSLSLPTIAEIIQKHFLDKSNNWLEFTTDEAFKAFDRLSTLSPAQQNWYEYCIRQHMEPGEGHMAKEWASFTDLTEGFFYFLDQYREITQEADLPFDPPLTLKFSNMLVAMKSMLTLIKDTKNGKTLLSSCNPQVTQPRKKIRTRAELCSLDAPDPFFKTPQEMEHAETQTTRILTHHLYYTEQEIIEHIHTAISRIPKELGPLLKKHFFLKSHTWLEDFGNSSHLDRNFEDLSTMTDIQLDWYLALLEKTFNSIDSNTNPYLKNEENSPEEMFSVITSNFFSYLSTYCQFTGENDLPALSPSDREILSPQWLRDQSRHFYRLIQQRINPSPIDLRPTGACYAVTQDGFQYISPTMAVSLEPKDQSPAEAQRSCSPPSLLHASSPASSSQTKFTTAQAKSLPQENSYCVLVEHLLEAIENDSMNFHEFVAVANRYTATTGYLPKNLDHYIHWLGNPFFSLVTLSSTDLIQKKLYKQFYGLLVMSTTNEGGSQLDLNRAKEAFSTIFDKLSSDFDPPQATDFLTILTEWCIKYQLTLVDIKNLVMVCAAESTQEHSNDLTPLSPEILLRRQYRIEQFLIADKTKFLSALEKHQRNPRPIPADIFLKACAEVCDAFSPTAAGSAAPVNNPNMTSKMFHLLASIDKQDKLPSEVYDSVNNLITQLKKNQEANPQNFDTALNILSAIRIPEPKATSATVTAAAASLAGSSDQSRTRLQLTGSLRSSLPNFEQIIAALQTIPVSHATIPYLTLLEKMKEKLPADCVLDDAPYEVPEPRDLVAALKGFQDNINWELNERKYRADERLHIADTDSLEDILHKLKILKNQITAYWGGFVAGMAAEVAFQRYLTDRLDEGIKWPITVFTQDPTLHQKLYNIFRKFWIPKQVSGSIETVSAKGTDDLTLFCTHVVEAYPEQIKTFFELIKNLEKPIIDRLIELLAQFENPIKTPCYASPLQFFNSILADIHTPLFPIAELEAIFTYPQFKQIPYENWNILKTDYISPIIDTKLTSEQKVLFIQIMMSCFAFKDPGFARDFYDFLNKLTPKMPAQLLTIVLKTIEKFMHSGESLAFIWQALEKLKAVIDSLSSFSIKRKNSLFQHFLQLFIQFPDNEALKNIFNQQPTPTQLLIILATTLKDISHLGENALTTYIDALQTATQPNKLQNIYNACIELPHPPTRENVLDFIQHNKALPKRPAQDLDDQKLRTKIQEIRSLEHGEAKVLSGAQQQELYRQFHDVYRLLHSNDQRLYPLWMGNQEGARVAYWADNLPETELPRLWDQCKQIIQTQKIILANPNAADADKTKAAEKMYSARITAVALVVEAVYRATNKYPYETQILAILDAFLHEGNTMLVLPTGAGKSIVNAMSDALLTVEGHTVNLCTKDLARAQSELPVFKPFFDYLGIAHAPEVIQARTAFTTTPLVIGGINYSNTRQMALTLQKYEHHLKLSALLHDRKHPLSLVLDESDAAALKDPTLTRIAQKQPIHFSENFYEIIYGLVTAKNFTAAYQQHYSKHKGRPEAIKDYIDFLIKQLDKDKAKLTRRDQKAIRQLKEKSSAEAEWREHLAMWIESAYQVSKMREQPESHAQAEYLEGPSEFDFAVVSHPHSTDPTKSFKVARVLNGPGIDLHSELSNGQQQFLHIRLRQEYKQKGEFQTGDFPIKPELSVISSMNSENFINAHSGRMISSTGTAGAAAEILEQSENFKCRISQIPPHEENRRKDLGASFYATDAEAIQALVNNVLAILRSSLESHFAPQPILIHTAEPDAIGSAERIYHALRDALNNSENSQIANFLQLYTVKTQKTFAVKAKQEKPNLINEAGDDLSSDRFHSAETLQNQVEQNGGLAGFITVTPNHSRGFDFQPRLTDGTPYPAGLCCFTFGVEGEAELAQKRGRAGRNGMVGITQEFISREHLAGSPTDKDETRVELTRDHAQKREAFDRQLRNRYSDIGRALNNYYLTIIQRLAKYGLQATLEAFTQAYIDLLKELEKKGVWRTSVIAAQATYDDQLSAEALAEKITKAGQIFAEEIIKLWNLALTGLIQPLSQDHSAFDNEHNKPPQLTRDQLLTAATASHFSRQKSTASRLEIRPPRSIDQAYLESSDPELRGYTEAEWKQLQKSATISQLNLILEVLSEEPKLKTYLLAIAPFTAENFSDNCGSLLLQLYRALYDGYKKEEKNLSYLLWLDKQQHAIMMVVKNSDDVSLQTAAVNAYDKFLQEESAIEKYKTPENFFFLQSSTRLMVRYERQQVFSKAQNIQQVLNTQINDAKVALKNLLDNYKNNKGFKWHVAQDRWDNANELFTKLGTIETARIQETSETSKAIHYLVALNKAYHGALQSDWEKDKNRRWSIFHRNARGGSRYCKLLEHLRSQFLATLPQDVWTDDFTKNMILNLEWKDLANRLKFFTDRLDVEYRKDSNLIEKLRVIQSVLNDAQKSNIFRYAHYQQLLHLLHHIPTQKFENHGSTEHAFNQVLNKAKLLQNYFTDIEPLQNVVKDWKLEISPEADYQLGVLRKASASPGDKARAHLIDDKVNNFYRWFGNCFKNIIADLQHCCLEYNSATKDFYIAVEYTEKTAHRFVKRAGKILLNANGSALKLEPLEQNLALNLPEFNVTQPPLHLFPDVADIAADAAAIEGEGPPRLT